MAPPLIEVDAERREDGAEEEAEEEHATGGASATAAGSAAAIITKVSAVSVKFNLIPPLINSNVALSATHLFLYPFQIKTEISKDSTSPSPPAAIDPLGAIDPLAAPAAIDSLIKLAEPLSSLSGADHWNKSCFTLIFLMEYKL